MAVYRKIEPRMFREQEFRELSHSGPSAQYLLVFLLVGPNTTSIPGLAVIGEHALAEQLKWPIEGFRKAFGELSQRGLAHADWNAQVVWVPRALHQNHPQSPNVLKAWRTAWPEIPGCELKVTALTELERLVQGMSKEFAKGFHEAFSEDLAKDGRKACPIQKQKQKQKQEEEQEQSSPSNSTIPTAPLPSLPDQQNGKRVDGVGISDLRNEGEEEDSEILRTLLKQLGLKKSFAPPSLLDVPAVQVLLDVIELAESTSCDDRAAVLAARITNMTKARRLADHPISPKDAVKLVNRGMLSRIGSTDVQEKRAVSHDPPHDDLVIKSPSNRNGPVRRFPRQELINSAFRISGKVDAATRRAFSAGAGETVMATATQLEEGPEDRVYDAG